MSPATRQQRKQRTKHFWSDVAKGLGVVGVVVSSIAVVVLAANDPERAAEFLQKVDKLIPTTKNPVDEEDEDTGTTTITTTITTTTTTTR